LAGLDATGLVGLLADAHRRRVVAAVELGAQHPDDVAAATNLTAAQVAKALGKLVQSGLVVTDSGGLRVAGDVFRHAAQQANVRPASTEFAEFPVEARKVLRSFVIDGRLQSVPVAPAKRLVVLDWLAQEFEPGERYTEAMVNLILGKRHADTAMLRRYLVDDGFLDRGGGQYWRTGGTVEP
jgi:hypothetical protein